MQRLPAQAGKEIRELSVKLQPGLRKDCCSSASVQKAATLLVSGRREMGGLHHFAFLLLGGFPKHSPSWLWDRTGLLGLRNAAAA